MHRVELTSHNGQTLLCREVRGGCARAVTVHDVAHYRSKEQTRHICVQVHEPWLDKRVHGRVNDRPVAEARGKAQLPFVLEACLSRLDSLFETRQTWLHHSRDEQESELDERHHASLVNSDSEADVGHLAVGWEDTLGHDPGEEEVEARAQHQSPDHPLTHRSRLVPVACEHAEN